MYSISILTIQLFLIFFGHKIRLMMIQKEFLTIQPVLRIQLTDKKCTRPTNSKLPYLHTTLQNCQLAAASVSKKSSVDRRTCLNVLGLVFMRTYVRTFMAPRGRLRGRVGGESQPCPNRVRLHHQIDQALPFFCVRATLKNREWPGDEARQYV